MTNQRAGEGPLDPGGDAAGDGTCAGWTPDLPEREMAPARAGPRTCRIGRWHLHWRHPGPPRAEGGTCAGRTPDLREREVPSPGAGPRTCGGCTPDLRLPEVAPVWRLEGGGAWARTKREWRM